MRFNEFKEDRTDEALPAVAGAIGRGIAKGATAAAKGATKVATNVAKKGVQVGKSAVNKGMNLAKQGLQKGKQMGMDAMNTMANPQGGVQGGPGEKPNQEAPARSLQIQLVGLPWPAVQHHPWMDADGGDGCTNG